MNKIFYVYIVPAFVFASVVMGGGYGTGREIVEFFTIYGLLGGILGSVVSICIFGLVLACTYEFARVFKVYDYRSFFKMLIGPFWVCFEILYLILFLLVLSVLSSAAGSMLEQEYLISKNIGVGILLTLILFLVYFGRETIEKVLTFWSIFMYLVFIYYFFEILSNSDTKILSKLSLGSIESGWLKGGILYPMYNLAIAPVLLFSTHAITTRKEAILAGIFSGVIVMVPAMLFHISYSVGYPDVLNQPVPNYWMISEYSSIYLLIIFLLALMGPLVQTGAGLVQGFLERIESSFKSINKNSLNKLTKITISSIILILSGVLSSIGIITLIAKGYSALSIGFAFVYIIPVCTLGLIKIIKFNSSLIDTKR